MQAFNKIETRKKHCLKIKHRVKIKPKSSGTLSTKCISIIAYKTNCNNCLPFASIRVHRVVVRVVHLFSFCFPLCYGSRCSSF